MSRSGKKFLIRVIIYISLLIFVILYMKLYKLGFELQCVINTIFHIKCPSCGATRSFISIVSGNLAAAVKYNPIYTLAIYPILTILFVQDFLTALYGAIKNIEVQSILEFLICPNKNGGKK